MQSNKKLMIKVCNLTPKNFHPIRYYRFDKEATMISHYCERLNIPFKFDTEADLIEIELPYNEEHISVEEALSQIDWDYIRKSNKKLIITKRRIIHFSRVKDILYDYIHKYNLTGKVFWFSINPYEKDPIVVYLNSLTNTYCEAYYLMVTRMMKLGISQNIVNLEPPQSSFDDIDKHFLCMGGEERPHRTYALDLIQNKKLNGYISRNFSGLDIGKYSFIWQQFSKDFLNYHSKSALNMVLESTANSSEIFITEKTYINFMIGRPFITVGNRYSLKFLRKYFNFKTFNFIDESYDEIDNTHKRVEKAVYELEKFCSMTLENAILLLHKNKDTFDHNRKVFLSLPHKKWFLQTLNGATNGRQRT